jgi:iron(III) transport system permease protein
MRLSVDGWVLAVLLALVGWLVIPPLAVLLFGSITDTPPAVPPHFTLDTLHYAYARPRIWLALAHSVFYAAATATAVLVIGGFLAWLVERTVFAASRIFSRWPPS